MATGSSAIPIVPPTKIIESTVVPGPQAQLPSFRNFQVLTKLVPGGMLLAKKVELQDDGPEGEAADQRLAVEFLDLRFDFFEAHMPPFALRFFKFAFAATDSEM